MPMAEEYKLLAELPWADPETEAITQIAADAGVPVSHGPEGAPEVSTDEFLIYGFEPDAVDRKAATEIFALDSNLTLVFADPVEERVAPGPLADQMLASARLLAAVEGARGVLITDYQPSAVILSFDDGQVTLNQDWAGWQTRPELLDAFPEPRTMTSLQDRS